MKKAHKKRPPCATANSPPGLPDMGEFYFINLKNFKISTKNIINTVVFTLSFISL